MKETNYRTKTKPIWCPGCGNYGTFKAIIKALTNLEIPEHQASFYADIGCWGRVGNYLSGYNLHGAHGRAITYAQGAKLAKPDLTVLAFEGDGGAFSIGAGHLPHAVRRNIDITLVVANNLVYALTKGQISPTTPFLEKGEEVSVGQIYNSPVDPLLDMIAYSVSTQASFIAQGIATDVPHLSWLIEEGIKHKGFSFISVLTPCPTYQAELFETIKKNAVYLKEGEEVELPDSSKEKPWIHDPSDIGLALKLAQTPVLEKPHLGIFFRGKEKR